MKEFKKPELFSHQMKGTTLGKIHEKGGERVDITKPLLLIALIFLGIFVGAEVVLHYMGNGEIDEVTTTSLVTTSTTSTSLITTITSTSLITTTSSSLVTTTTPECGSDWEPPCENESEQECAPGYDIGAEGLCHEVECAPSVPSGKEGCGVWAVREC